MTLQSAVNTLTKVRTGRPVVQDYCPLAQSLEWRMGQSYLQQRGNKAFTSDPSPVPFGVTNDGTLSAGAAAVFYANVAAADRAGTLEPTLFVLELGIGVGLFARFFLDAFRSLCERHGTDYYDRLCYVAGDYSEKMLLDAGRHGIFGGHPGRYVFRVVDALCPEKTLGDDPVLAEGGVRPFRAVFLNYLLDCLPAAVLKIEGQEFRELWVRSCLARGADLRAYTDLTLDDLVRIAQGTDAQSSKELREVYGLLSAEYEYRPVNPADLPYGDTAVRFARATAARLVVHNHGAIQALERLRGLVRDTGFILINDYGSMRAEGADEFQHQRYSHSTFVGINFPLLKAHFTQVAENSWVEPSEDESIRIHARLLGRQLTPETAACFQSEFGPTARKEEREAAEWARQCLKSGRLEAALSGYQRALERQPYNWALMNEVAHFLTFTLRDAAAGLDMAGAALACNPSCSADLWNLHGDCLFELGRVEEALRAFRRALEINPQDARAHFNLAFVHARRREYPEALRRIAEALLEDRAGTYRERLLQIQADVLAQLARRFQQESLWTADRISPEQGPFRREASAGGEPSKPGPAGAAAAHAHLMESMLGEGKTETRIPSPVSEAGRVQ
jgi:tetratricopeptide (TPR) repeat protein